MNLSFYIARRYLFSKKRHQVINLISAVAVAGVALATMAMICTLSVFNGFQGVVTEQLTAMDPDIKVLSVHGKGFRIDTEEVGRIKSLPQLEVVSFSVEDKVMVQYGGKQVMVTLKGVDENFTALTNIEDALYGRGSFVLKDSLNSYAVMGGELMYSLNCGISFTSPLEVFAPDRGGRINLTVPARNFKKGVLLSSGLIFAVNQPRYDANYILTSCDFARDIFRRDSNEATAIEIRVKAGESIERAKDIIKDKMGAEYKVLDRYEQQNDIYKVMRVEKLISYMFLSFILLVACFNIIGSLSMLIIEKSDNMNTLRSFGADSRTISNIFVFEGCMISAIGAIAGILLGLLLCLAQQEFGILSTGGDGGSIMDSYPVEVEFGDIIAVFITVLVTGFMAVWLPVRLLTRRFV